MHNTDILMSLLLTVDTDGLKSLVFGVGENCISSAHLENLFAEFAKLCFSAEY